MINFKRLAVGVAGFAAIGLLATACNLGGTSTAGNDSNGNSEGKQLTQYGQGQPIPGFSYSSYRQTLINIEATQALGEKTTSLFFNMGGADPIFTCPSEGQAVPNTAQLSNPAHPVWSYNGSDGVSGITVGQIDPNGVYSPTNSTGTNVVCFNTSGQKYLVYWEGFVLTVSSSAHWDYTNHHLTVTGAPNMPNCKVENVTSAGKTVQQNVCTK